MASASPIDPAASFRDPIGLLSRFAIALHAVGEELRQADGDGSAAAARALIDAAQELERCAIDLERIHGDGDSVDPSNDA